MDKHFELTNKFIINAFGVKLFQIKCTRRIKYAEVGDLGGYIEKEDNLSGDAWVSGDAQVSGELANTSSYGYYWSSSPYYGGSNYAGSLSFSSGNVYPLDSNNRAYGFSVRCVRDKE